MSTIETLPGAGAHSSRPVNGHQSLSRLAEERSVTLDTSGTNDARQRMAQSLSIGEERNLIDATKDIAANLFNAFRNEMRGALNHVGIRGEMAAELVRDVSRSFVEAVRSGTSFSFGMIAAAYKETIVQTATSVSHSLEFSANALSIEYNHATGELTADTSKLEIDAVKMIQSDNLPAQTAALFDFTDSDGPPSMATIFDRVHQYLVNTGFAGEEGAEDDLLALPDANAANYDAVLINDAHAEKPVKGDAPPAFAVPTEENPAPNSVIVHAIDEFTNARQESITRMTFDLIVRVHMGKDMKEPEVSQLHNNTNERFEITV